MPRVHTYCCILFLCVTLSCHDTEPTSTYHSIPPDPPKFDRTSDWAIDTIGQHDFGFYISAIGCSGPSDIYLVGAGAMHFNGTNWSPVPIDAPNGVAYSFFDIYCINAANVWMVGSESFGAVQAPAAFYFNGTAWTRMTIPSNSSGPFRGVWGISQNQVWLGAALGTILRYNGTALVSEELQFHPTAGDYWDVRGFAGNSSGAQYALIYLANSSTPYEAHYLIQRIQGKWQLIDSTSTTNNRCRSLYLSPDNVLYSAGNHLSRWNGTTWDVVRAGQVVQSVYQVLGNSDSNIFIAGGSVYYGANGFIEHYNGTNWATVSPSGVQQLTLVDASTNGSSVSALGLDASLNYYVVRSR